VRFQIHNARDSLPFQYSSRLMGILPVADVDRLPEQDALNFGRIHQILRRTPAMEAGISQRAWSIQAIVPLCGNQISSQIA
jgi:hypothetical protein